MAATPLKDRPQDHGLAPLAPLQEEARRELRKHPPRPGTKSEPAQESTRGTQEPLGERTTAPGGPDELLAGDGAAGNRPARPPSRPREPKTTHGGAEGLAPKNQSGQGGESA